MTDELTFGGIIAAVLAGAIRRGTPMAFAAMGESVAERSGIINLGVEGMMLVGAMVAFAVQAATGSAYLAVFAGGSAALLLSAIHGILVVHFNANQIISGFAITILGTGLSGFFGRPYVGVQIEGIPVWEIPYLSELPFIGPILFRHDPLVYFSVVAAAALWFLLHRTRFGLHLRAVGEDPHASFAQGVQVARIRISAVLIGGFFAGLGGAHLSLAYTHVWAEKMTAGQGWIAVGLVIVASWSPMRSVGVAWIFGAIMVLHPHLQAAGIGAPPYLIAMLPYLVAILALTVSVLLHQRRGFGLPAALAKQFRLDK